jgi:AhpD family alkylhydroperoxidase
MNLVTNRGRMQGFIILDYLPRAMEAIEALMGWVASGDIIYQVDMQEGLTISPVLLQRLYTGQNLWQATIKNSRSGLEARTMSQISKKDRQELSALAPMLDMVEAGMGFVPNSMLTMAHWPELLGAFGGLGATILQTGEVEPELKQLIALVSSRASGCNYCQAHTSHSAHSAGAGRRKNRCRF